MAVLFGCATKAPGRLSALVNPSAYSPYLTLCQRSESIIIASKGEVILVHTSMFQARRMQLPQDALTQHLVRGSCYSINRRLPLPTWKSATEAQDLSTTGCEKGGQATRQTFCSRCQSQMS